MTSAERRWCLMVSAIVVILTTIPYLIGFETQGENWRFTGFVFGVEDGNSYIAKMLQGAQGDWLFRTPYGSRVESGVIAFLPYLLLGKLAQGADLHTQLVALFHLARVILIPIATVVIYRFASVFLVEGAWRRWATVLIVAGGGLGWALMALGRTSLLGSLPLELYSPEAFGFLSFYGLPHLLLARVLLLTALLVYLQVQRGWKRGLVAGAALLGLGLVQPLTVVSAYAAIAGHLIVLAVGRAARRTTGGLREWTIPGGVAVAVSLPVMIYYAAGTLGNPSLRNWTAQNVLPSPNPVHYLLAFGLLLVPAVIGGHRAVRDDGPAGAFLPIWFVALVVLAYAPVTFQRRLVDGAWVALVVLAARGLAMFEWKVGWRRFVPGGLLITSLATTAVLLAGGVWGAIRPRAPIFRDAKEVEALAWMAGNVPEGSVVLASFDVGNVVPAWAPLRSVMGHGPETPDLARIRPRVEAFFGSGTSDAARQGLIDEQAVDIIFHGPAERLLGSWDPGGFEGLEKIYDEGEYAVYAVLR